MCEVTQLTLQDGAGSAHLRWRIRLRVHRAANQFADVLDRGQWVAQLVTERGKKLILEPIGFALQTLPFLAPRDITGDLGGTDDLALFVADRRDCERDLDTTAALGLTHRLEMFDALASAQLRQNVLF